MLKKVRTDIYRKKYISQNTSKDIFFAFYDIAHSIKEIILI